MTVEIRVPTLGELVTEATVAKWLKQPGERVERDEPVVELETDKVTLEVPAPQAGRDRRNPGRRGRQRAGRRGARDHRGRRCGGQPLTPARLPASGERESTATPASSPLPAERGEGAAGAGA